MSRRLPGSLLLVALLIGLLSTHTAWAGSKGDENHVLVRISPLVLLLKNDVTIKVGDFTCQLVAGVDPASVCADLPPGDYDVSATSDGFIVMPTSYPLTISGDPDVDSSTGASEKSEFFFRLFQIENQLYMPMVQGKR